MRSIYLGKLNEGRLQPAQVTQAINFLKSNQIFTEEPNTKMTGAFVKDLDFDGEKDIILEKTTIKEQGGAPYVQFLFFSF